MVEMMSSPRSRGIYLVANKNSEEQCANLVYSIRRCGCALPIRIIPYGGEPAACHSGWEDVVRLSLGDFPADALAFVCELEKRIPLRSKGHLRRFLAWFGEFDEFLYSDNDVVALMNWEAMFSYLDHHELVHADREYTTGGRYNLNQPGRFEELMGRGALELAVTAGHFLCRRSSRHPADLLAGLAWMEAHPGVAKWHDQALLHVTVAQARWPTLNLCKPPHNWGSSWAGDYSNTLDLFRTIQGACQPISHLHYSGYIASGADPIDELTFSRLPARQRNRRLLGALLRQSSGLVALQNFVRRARRKAARIAGAWAHSE